jgi:hypothetical protein
VGLTVRARLQGFVTALRQSAHAFRQRKGGGPWHANATRHASALVRGQETHAAAVPSAFADPCASAGQRVLERYTSLREAGAHKTARKVFVGIHHVLREQTHYSSARQ